LCKIIKAYKRWEGEAKGKTTGGDGVIEKAKCVCTWLPK